jgi:hypothetical protein
MLQEKDLAKKCAERLKAARFRNGTPHREAVPNRIQAPRTLLRVNLRNRLLVFHRLSPFIRNSAFRRRHAQAPPGEPPRLFVYLDPVSLFFGHAWNKIITGSAVADADARDLNRRGRETHDERLASNSN